MGEKRSNPSNYNRHSLRFNHHCRLQPRDLVECAPGPERPPIPSVPILPEVRPHFVQVIVLTVMVHLSNSPLVDICRIWRAIARDKGVSAEMFFNEFGNHVAISLGTELMWASIQFVGRARSITGHAGNR